MTTTTAPARTGHSAGRGVTFGGVLRSEWIKLRSLRSTWWCFAIMLVVIVGFGALLGASAGFTTGGAAPSGDQAQQITVFSATGGIAFGQLVAAVLGALVITGEYGTGMIRSTFTAVPRRTSAVVAKLLLVTLSTFVVSLVAVLLALLVTRPMLAGIDVEADLGDGDLWLALVAAAGSVALIGAIGFGLGSIIRLSAAAVATGIGIVFVLPILFQILILSVGMDKAWPANLQEFSPSQAATRMYEYQVEGQAGLLTGVAVDGAVVLEPWQAGLVLVGWAVLLLVIGLALVKRRDV